MVWTRLNGKVGVSITGSGLTKRAADRASPWWYGAGLLAMVLVCGGVLPVRPAANANRWHAPDIMEIV
jgi:hypothetical protein